MTVTRSGCRSAGVLQSCTQLRNNACAAAASFSRRLKPSHHFPRIGWHVIKLVLHVPRNDCSPSARCVPNFWSLLLSERKLLQPGRLTVTQTAQGNPDLSTLVSALQKSGLAGGSLSADNSQLPSV